MYTLLEKRLLVFVISISMISYGVPPASEAGIIGTQEYVMAQERGQMLIRIDAYLAKENVRKQMIALGVDPDDAQQRLSALTDEELRRLDGEMDSMPVGGYYMPEIITKGELYAMLALIGIVLFIIAWAAGEAIDKMAD
jgi:hypothetical protein